METQELPLTDLPPMSVAGLDLDSTAHLRRVLTLATGCQARLRRQGNQTSSELDRLCKTLRKAYRNNRNLERRKYYDDPD